MSVYTPQDYLFVCEDDFFGVGCGREFLVQRSRTRGAAFDSAKLAGWYTTPAGEDSWGYHDSSAMCPVCVDEVRTKLKRPYWPDGRNEHRSSQ